MLEHIPGWLGHLLRNVRAGHSKIVAATTGLAESAAFIDLTSPAFGSGARLPVRFTADGEGISPPLVWGDIPADTQCLVLIVEDPDAPAINPLVHAIVWGLGLDERRLAEGAIARGEPGADDGRDVGRNSYLAEGWLPPDPPKGHGSHDYVFQLFALSHAPEMTDNPGRAAIVAALEDHVIGVGVLVGTYSREEPSDLGTQMGGPALSPT